MPTQQLPNNPDIEQLKGHAKLVRDMVRANVAGAIDLVREHHPKHVALAANSAASQEFKLTDAQLTIARHY